MAGTADTVKVVLLRHGESLWNAENRFTGWADVVLSPVGEAEALAAGKLIAEAGLGGVDAAFTSVLRRAVSTLDGVLATLGAQWVPVVKSWRLNERHYGALQGLDKAETLRLHGAAQVKVWRRAFAVPPPALELSDERHPRHDRRYAALGVATTDLPCSESLRDCIARVLPLWEGEVSSLLRAGRHVLIVAHGNSLRALIKHLDGISDEDIAELNVPTGIPFVFELDRATLRPVRPHYYLGDADEAKRKAEAVANQAAGGGAGASAS